MAVSEDVLRLVRTVERLPLEDQNKILRIVDLLSLVPISVQDKTQKMLRELLDSAPASRTDCVLGIDDVIGYLEQNVSRTPEFRGHFALHGVQLNAKQRLS
jgi:hypothetical protein